jgi:Tol biopolymer transport system component/tRNA A-37 threonylcarbamoyl transferase component Bud32
MKPGSQLGPYEVLAPIGAGGMGEVYRARDTRLNRDVAIKVLPKHIASRPDLQARFEREARAVGGLNHPHICVLYDIGHQDGVDFMVMEHLEGETLAARLGRGALPLDQVLKYGGQIADALDRAHRKGLFHRDIKPANIMITRDGVKVLDFGLAKTAPKSAEDDATVSAALTGEGTLLGTPHYIAPEQYEGKEADARSDIFAFGCVLYEMTTGRRCFDGKTRSIIAAAVLASEPPPMNTLQPIAPIPLARLVKVCMVKDPEARIQSMWDVLLALRAIGEANPESASVKSARPWLAWGLAAAALIAALSLAVVHFREVPPVVEGARFQLEPPAGFKNFFQLSPDGKSLAMVADRKLWIRPLASLEAKVVEGVDDPAYPFWSPDSSSIGFVSQGKLRRVAVSGGVVQTLCDAPYARGATWGGAGTILFSIQAGLQQVGENGGTPVSITTAAVGDAHRYPVFLPDGRSFLYLHLSGKSEVAGVYVGTLGEKTAARILPDITSAVYAPGYVLFRRDSTLMAKPFDAATKKVFGDALPIAPQVSQAGHTAFGAFSVSNTGNLVYRTAVRKNSELVWVDQTGQRLNAMTKPMALRAFALAGDQSRMALSVLSIEKDSSQPDIWLQESANAAASRFTYGPAPGWSFPVWSPDGSEIAYATADIAGSKSFGIYRRKRDMSGKEVQLFLSKTEALLRDWSRDGKWMVYAAETDLWLLPLTGDRTPKVFLRSPASDEDYGQFSPNGSWLAYVSNESGQDQVYVQPLPVTGAKWQISTAGGSYPRWSGDGKVLYFVASDGKLMAVPVGERGGSLETGAPRSLFELRASELTYASPYQVSADGKRFLVAVAPVGERQTPLTMALQWAAELKKF